MKLAKCLLPLALALGGSAYANNVFIVTSFDSFPGVSYNPTQAVVSKLPNYVCKNATPTCDEQDKVYIMKHHMSVLWSVVEDMPLLVDSYATTANVVGVMSLGYDPRMNLPRGLTLEKFALNRAEGQDADGYTRDHYMGSGSFGVAPVMNDTPNVLSMPDDIQLDLVKQQIQDAFEPFAQADKFFGMSVERVRVGDLDQHNTYICNATLYANLYTTQNTDMFGGFVHIKYPDELITEQMMADAVQIYIQHVVDVRLDNNAQSAE